MPRAAIRAQRAMSQSIDTSRASLSRGASADASGPEGAWRGSVMFIGAESSVRLFFQRGSIAATLHELVNDLISPDGSAVISEAGSEPPTHLYRLSVNANTTHISPAAPLLKPTVFAVGLL